MDLFEFPNFKFRFKKANGVLFMLCFQYLLIFQELWPLLIIFRCFHLFLTSSFLVIEQLVLFVCHEARACYTRDLYSSWMLSSALLTIRSSLDLQFSVSKEFDICMCYYLGITWPIVHRSSSLNEALWKKDTSLGCHDEKLPWREELLTRYRAPFFVPNPYSSRVAMPVCRTRNNSAS